MPPAPVDLRISYRNGDGATVPLAAGDTISDTTAPLLVMEWDSSSDGSGLLPVLAGWGSSATPDRAALQPTTAQQYSTVVGDRQVRYAHLIIRDGVGNETVQTVGPIYIDGRLTPDIVHARDYHGWRDNGCTLLGVDRRESRRFADGAGSIAQRFYATWDETALRLAWSGADWNTDGHLFIYLDTVAGGTSVVFDPFNETNQANIELPLRDGKRADADYLLWVADDQTINLYQWDGSAWQVIDNAGIRYQFAMMGTDHLTDIVLPFALVQLTSASPLSLIALASREQKLDIWATMPSTNPLVSAEMQRTASTPVQLSQKYVWETLGSGQCVNANEYTDADLVLQATADPAGITLSYLQDNLADRFDLARLEALQNTDDEEGQQSLQLLQQVKQQTQVHTEPAMYGQDITYTIQYRNDGTAPADGVQLVVKAWGPLQLRDPAGGTSAELVLPLEQVAPGAAASVLIQGIVDARPDAGTLASDYLGVSVYVTNAERGLFDWLLLAHSIDSDAPTNVALTTVTTGTQFVQPGINVLQGTAL
ncbi:MAG: hypothetical protein HC876_14685, partial [Chloroflexaceae bacterium]|nr:hypothetical protein [Chloroflexaceae bacterium]